MNKVFKYIGTFTALASTGIIVYLGIDIITSGVYSNTNLTILAVNGALLSALLKNNG